ncbi:MAG: hypothetical protein KC506_03260 [Nanoarchaeota archaeon]|nr:hypothetical protein [Nanoarchaeota archaeon]
MKKEAKSVTSKDNSFGVASVILGIIGILSGGNGLIYGIIGFIFASKQQRHTPNSWSKAGKILSIIAVILGIVSIIIAIKYFTQNPDLLNQFNVQ